MCRLGGEPKENRENGWKRDLEQEMDVRAVQINFADDALPIESPGEIQGYTDTAALYRGTGTCYKMDTGRISGWKYDYFMIEDKSEVGDRPAS